MGGIGKTTLAQWVYNDHRVISHFDERAWVCVSDNFEVMSILKMMLDGKACKLETLENVQHKLVRKLSGNKFLLVMDDMWNEVQQKWTNLKSVLKCVAQGSSIPFHSMYSLTCLSEEESWLLFMDCAFGQGREEVVNLVEIGKEIVKKCVGIPLAVKSLGGLMWSKRRVVEWEQVRLRDSKIWELREEEASGIMPALRLSYKHLPSHLKQCFAICSIYPKDFELDREQLIYLWMANAYLQSDGTMELEAFGMLIFHELVCRSFFQGCKMEIEFGIETGVTCKMHDLMHDLASLVSVNELSVVEIGRGNGVVKCTRHLSLVLDSRTTAESSNHLSLAKSKSMLRTLIVLGSYKAELNQLIFWKIFILSGIISINTLPNSIGKMKHLKYLDLARSSIDCLPESICKLRNLKCLIVRDCRSLQSLPEGMSKMRGLRHLDFEGCRHIIEMPNGMEQLTQLQTLRGDFVVCPMSETEVINGLKGMKQLRGHLIIRGLQYVRNAEADLVKGTQHLSLLALCYTSSWNEGECGVGAEKKLYCCVVFCIEWNTSL